MLLTSFLKFLKSLYEKKKKIFHILDTKIKKEIYKNIYWTVKEKIRHILWKELEENLWTTIGQILDNFDKQIKEEIC